MGLLRELRPRVTAWPYAILLTFTVDPAMNPDPEAAYDRATKLRAIGKTLAALSAMAEKLGFSFGSDWFKVLELHQPQNGGMPHWHVLVRSERARVPKEMLEEARRLWRDRFKVGRMVNFKADPKRSAQGNPTRGLNYVAKYLVKGVKVPPWIEERTRRIRFTEMKRVGKQPAAAPAAETSSAGAEKGSSSATRAEAGRGSGPRSYGERANLCGLAVEVLRVEEADDGSLHLVHAWWADGAVEDVQDVLRSHGKSPGAVSDGGFLLFTDPKEVFMSTEVYEKGHECIEARTTVKRAERRVEWQNYCEEAEARRKEHAERADRPEREASSAPAESSERRHMPPAIASGRQAIQTPRGA